MTNVIKNVVTLNNLSDKYFDKGENTSQSIETKFSYSIDRFRSSTNLPDIIYITDINKEGLFKYDNTDTTSLDDNFYILVKGNLRYKRVKEIISSGKSKIEKYTNENQLPTIGNFKTVYFLNVNNNKYLKFWNGTSYINTSILTLNCISDYKYDYYAKYSDINLSLYSGNFQDIVVIEDELNNNNGIGRYFYNGLTINELLLL